MPTNTTNYSFKKPVVGADEDLWGGYINDNLDDLDSLLGDGAPLHLDTANNRVGVGTASPATPLDVTGGTSSTQARFGGTAGRGLEVSTATTFSTPDAVAVLNAPTASYGTMLFQTQSTERMRITSGGDVGIATSSPASIGTGIPTLEIKGNNASQSDRSGAVSLQRQDGAGGMYIGSIDGSHRVAGTGSYPMAFLTNGSERMRIDASGNVLVGKTGASSSTQGILLEGGTGQVVATATSNFPLYANRLTTDGELVRFAKNNTTVGSIGVVSGRTYIASDNGSTGCGVLWGTNGMFPTNRSGTLTDNTYDVGASSYRWDDIYATNGTIQTSDRNEKQQITPLTDAEITAAKAISKLFKTFKWNDAVTEKGDAARKHAGVIAQDVQQAMADAGLDAGDYAFFISSTWWETQTDVPAVEAVEAQDAVYDEDGNLISEAVDAVDAKEAYTRTDTYDTLEEAPEGATERTRLGIRYPELLAFIGAATEQRLASIEARLDAIGA